MNCPACHAQNRAEARFCHECGARFQAICPQCHAPVGPTSKFCDSCGAQLGDSPRPAPPPSTFSSPQSYTPKHLAEKILISRESLEGERKQVTVLFADLKGSMELLADRDPEEARNLLDPVLDRMMGAVHRYEGTVNQVMGDGVMALFGAPIAHEDHAVRACYAALAMQSAISQYTDEVRRSHGVEIQIRVGLNSGEVVVRAVGSDLRMDYSAVGQTTHLAARMEQLATPGTTRLTADTLRLSEGFVQVRPLGPIPVRGLSEPVEAFELIGAGSSRTRLQAAAARGLTRFVGRQREIEGLDQALERAVGGQGQVVALVGEAGVGKSRLFWEFTHSHRTQGCTLLESSSVSYGRATAYFPIIAFLREYLQIEDSDDHRRIREKLTGKLLTLDEALRPIMSPLLSLLDVPNEDPEWQALEAPRRRQRTLDAVKRLVLRESQVRPVILVFEDLHWIDAETQAFLDGLVESLPTARLLLLVNYRPDYQHGWGGKSYYTQLRIDPLVPASANELLQHLLGDDSGLEPLKRLVVERTDGNPFFLEESVRTLIETQVLVGQRGAYRLARTLAQIQVPATVQAILAARIDRLPASEKRLLQTASVIGKDVSFKLLHAIADFPEDALQQGLAHLQTAEFLYETRLFPDIEYTFKHGLTHQVAYGGLLQDRRRALHARVVEVLELTSPDRPAEQVDRLAYHATRGEIWDKALAYSRQAGAKAASRSAHREAIACLEQALTALDHLPDHDDALAHAIDVRIDLRNSLVTLGQFEPILRYLKEAETIACRLGDERRLGRVSAAMSNYFWSLGELWPAIESGERARTIADRLGDRSLHVDTNLRLGQAYHALGEYRPAIEHLTAAVETLAGDLVHERFGFAGLPSVFARNYLTRCLAELGRFDEGLVWGQESVRIAQAANHPYSLAFACFGLGSHYLRRADLGPAIELLEQSSALCEMDGMPLIAAAMAPSLGYAYALAGRMPAAVALLEPRQGEQSSKVGRSLRLAWLGHTYLLMGRAAEAARLAAEALELARTHGERGHQVWALWLFGEVGVAGEPVGGDGGRTAYGDAIALADELGMRPLLAHAHAGLARATRLSGDSENARHHVTLAIDLFREMAMARPLAAAVNALEEITSTAGR